MSVKGWTVKVCTCTYRNAWANWLRSGLVSVKIAKGSTMIGRKNDSKIHVWTKGGMISVWWIITNPEYDNLWSVPLSPSTSNLIVKTALFTSTPQRIHHFPAGDMKVGRKMDAVSVPCRQTRCQVFITKDKETTTDQNLQILEQVNTCCWKGYHQLQCQVQWLV